MAQIAIAGGDSTTAEVEFTAALAELARYPVPVVEWKVYAELGRLKSTQGDAGASRKAFARAAEIVNACAANVADPDLRATFMNSDAVRGVLTGAT